MNNLVWREFEGVKAFQATSSSMRCGSDLFRPILTLIAALVLSAMSPAVAADKPMLDAREHGSAAELSYGGRLYDNHWGVMGLAAPVLPNPTYPADPAEAPNSTWRCVSCHGWDYAGSKGHLREIGSQFVGLHGAKGRSPDEITKQLRNATHRQLVERLPPEALRALSLFVCCGQHDASTLIGPNGEGIGDPLKGTDIYEGVCSRCHQADGKASIYGEKGDMSSLGWIARERPAQAVHKIINGVPSADMLSLRFLEADGIRDLLTYLQSLDAQ